MFHSRRLTSLVFVVVAGLSAAGCGTDVSVDLADPVPPAIETTVVTPDPPRSDVVATIPAPSVAPGPNRVRQPVPDAERSYSSIQDVDFANGFTYASGFDEGVMATVADGGYENGEWGDPEYFLFTVTEIEFGDLDGDGVDEAVVATSLNTGGSGHFDRLNAFRLVDGKVEEAGTAYFGDRADGGIYNVRVEEGLVKVWSFSTTLGACCPTELTENRLVMGDWLVQADRSTTRAFMVINHQKIEELQFLAGTSSAVVARYPGGDGTFAIEASAGQRLTVLVTDGPAPTEISVTDTSTGQVMSGLADMVLPSDAIYHVTVTSDPSNDVRITFDVIIDDGEPTSPISWAPRVEQQTLTEEPLVRTSLVWPDFSASAPGTDAANLALSTYVIGLDDYWVDDVTNFTPPLDDSTYELSYKVTLATPEIASVHFDFYEYVCCRPHPNYGQRAVVLDLVTGQVIPVSEIIDVNRIGDINAIWFAELVAQGMLPDDQAIVEGEDVVRFDSLTLVPGGIELGTDRGSLGGGLPGTRTVLTFEQLGGLVNPALVARLATG